MEKNTKKIIYSISGVLIVFLFATYGAFFAPPLSFQKDSIVTISSGTGVQEAGELLKAKSIIQSPFVFSILVRFIYPSGIIANHYSFSRPQSVLTVAYRLAKGKTDLVPLKVTIPEGSSSFEI